MGGEIIVCRKSMCYNPAMVERRPQQQGSPAERPRRQDIRVSTVHAIRRRVMGIVGEADPGIVGTPQEIGGYQVTITLTPAGESGEVRTSYLAEQDGVPVAEYSKISDGHGVSMGDTHRLYEDVDGDRVRLTLTRAARGAPSLLISFPNPDQTLPGRMHSMTPEEHDPAYLASVTRAFNIPLQFK
jgi:hypothetical protein